MTQKWYKSRTLWLNIISAVLAILALPEFISVLPVSALPYIALASAIGNMILRVISTKSISS